MSLTESNTGEQTILDTVAAQVLLHTDQELLAVEMPNPRWPVRAAGSAQFAPPTHRTRRDGSNS
jgi:hypothetical protein